MKTDKYQSLQVISLKQILNQYSSKKKLSVVIFGNFGAYNIGDEAILAGQLAELKKMSNIKPIVVARFPIRVKKIHGVSAVSMTNIIDVIKHINNAELVIIGGGGIFCKNPNGVKGFIFQIYTLLLYFFYPLLLKKNVYVLGIGIYKNMDKLISFLTFSLLKYAKAITVRDFHSLKLLRLHRISAMLYKDNSYLLKETGKNRLKQFPVFNNISEPGKRNIAFALKYPATFNEKQQLIASVKQFIQQNCTSAQFWFYQFDTHPAYQNDSVIINELLMHIPEHSCKELTYYIVPADLPPDVILSSFDSMDFIVAMRLHAMLFSYRAKKAFIGISYDEKCTSFLSSIGKRVYFTNTVTLSMLQSEFSKTRREYAN